MARHRPHLLVSVPRDETESLAVSQEAVRHLEQVMRMGSGEVSYTDGEGLRGIGLYRDGLVVRGEETREPKPAQLTVAVAPPRTNSRVRFVVEKLAELGVSRLVWLRTAHTEGRPPRLEKVGLWAAGALEQSRGAWLMQVADEPVPVGDVAALGTPVFADAGGSSAMEVALPADPVLCIGPEGGFAPGEVPAEALRIGLGTTILRVETAAIAGAAIMRARMEWPGAGI